MPAFISAKSATAFEGLAQQADESLNPGRVIISGRGYDVAIIRDALQPMQLESGGEAVMQALVFSLAKVIRSTAFPRGQMLTHDGLGWKIDSIDGYNAGDSAWHYTCTRAPGADL